jgi:hypothetical protein
MNDLHVDIEHYEKGEINGATAFRLVVRRTGEPTRGVFTYQRPGENDAQTIDRLVVYHSAHPADLLPIVEENERLTEI